MGHKYITGSGDYVTNNDEARRRFMRRQQALGRLGRQHSFLCQHCFRTNTAFCANTAFVPPLLSYEHCFYTITAFVPTLLLCQHCFRAGNAFYIGSARADAVSLFGWRHRFRGKSASAPRRPFTP